MITLTPISIYIHWPFCLALCPYCDFNSHIIDAVDSLQWAHAYKKELNYFTDQIVGKKIRSIFFGGGTPSLMQPQLVGSIIDTIASMGNVDSSTEITLEANPTSYEVKKFKEFKLAGINRVSLGVQSLNNDSLRLLGRQHQALDAIAAVESVAHTFKHYSFDLIYALPDQTITAWHEELSKAVMLANGHISLYQLTIEKGTPFFKLHNQGLLTLPTNDIAADMYEWSKQYLQGFGYNNYEISNYAVPGAECLHNLNYWHYDEYIGIGPGAHSRIKTQDNHAIQALMMLHKPAAWLTKVETLGVGIQSCVTLTPREIALEALMMGSRLSKGILKHAFYSKTGIQLDQFIDHKLSDFYQQQGLLVNDQSNFRLTDKGLLLHSYILARLVP